MALLPCYSFLYDTDFAPVLRRLATSIRGIGNPLVAAYARWFLARKTAILVRNDERQRDCLAICLNDQLSMARDALSGRYPSSSDLATWRISLAGYHHLFLPVYSAFAAALGGVGKQLSLARGPEAAAAAAAAITDPLCRAAAVTSVDRATFLTVMGTYAAHCRCAGVLVHLLEGFSPVVWACQWPDDGTAGSSDVPASDDAATSPLRWSGVESALALGTSAVPSAYTAAPEVAVAVVKGLLALRRLRAKSGCPPAGDADGEGEGYENAAPNSTVKVPNAVVEARALLAAWKAVAGIADPARALALAAPLLEAATVFFPKAAAAPAQAAPVVVQLLQEVAARVSAAAALQREVSAGATTGFAPTSSAAAAAAQAAAGSAAADASDDCSVPGLPAPAPSALGVIEEAGGTPPLLGAGDASLARGAVASTPGRFWERDALRHRARVPGGGASSSPPASPHKPELTTPHGPPASWPDWSVSASAASGLAGDSSVALSGVAGPVLLAAIARIGRAVWRWELAPGAAAAAAAIGSAAYGAVWGGLGPAWQPALAAAALADAFPGAAVTTAASPKRWSDLQTVYAALELARAVHDSETRGLEGVAEGPGGTSPGAALAVALLASVNFGRNLDRYLTFLGDARRALPGYHSATVALAVLGLKTAARAWRFVDGNHRPATRRFAAAVFGHVLGMTPSVEHTWLRLALWLAAAAAARGSGTPDTGAAAVAAAIDDLASCGVGAAGDAAALTAAVPALQTLAAVVAGHELSVPPAVWAVVTHACPAAFEAGWEWPAPWVSGGDEAESRAPRAVASAAGLALLRGLDAMTSTMEGSRRAVTAAALLAAVLTGVAAGSSAGPIAAAAVAQAAAAAAPSAAGKSAVALDPLTLAAVTQPAADGAASAARPSGPLTLSLASLRLEVAAQALTALRGQLTDPGAAAALRGATLPAPGEPASSGPSVMALVLSAVADLEKGLLPQAAAAVAAAGHDAALLSAGTSPSPSAVDALVRRVGAQLTAVKLDLVA